MDAFFQIQYNQDSHWLMPRFHFHDAYEITIVRSGHGEMSVGSQTFAMEQGTVLLLNNGVIHRSQVVDDAVYGRYVLKIPSDYLAKLSTPQTDLMGLFHRPCFLLTEPQLETVTALCQQAMAETADFGQDLLRQNALIALLIQLSRWAGHAQQATPYHAQSLHRMSPVMDYLTAHATQSIALDDLASTFFITKQHLCYSFKKATGLSINQYLTAQRLWLACGHLRAGLGVQLAGERSGFGNNAHFIRTFKTAFGVSPGKYAATYHQAIFAPDL